MAAGVASVLMVGTVIGGVGCNGGGSADSVAAKVGDVVISAAEVRRFMTADPGGDLTTTRAYDPVDRAACLKHKVTNHSALLPSATAAARRAEKAKFRKECVSEERINLGKALGFLIRAEWLKREASRSPGSVGGRALRSTFEEAATPSLLYAKVHGLERGLLASTPVSRRDIARYYHRNRDVYYHAEERAVRYIVSSSRAKAAAARAALRTGKPWRDVVARYSTDAESRMTVLGREGGDEYHRAVVAASPGVILGPTRSPWGWYTFEVTGVKPGSGPPFREVAPSIRDELRAQRLTARLHARYAGRTTCLGGYRSGEVPECSRRPVDGR